MLDFSSVKLDMNITKEHVVIEEVSGKDIAIIGISCRYPLAESTDEFWSNICNGKENAGEFPRARRSDTDQYLAFRGFDIEKTGYLKGRYLEEIDKFDCDFFRMSPKEAALTSPNQRLFLQTAWETIEDAGYGGKKLSGSRTGVYMGFDTDMRVDYKRFIMDLRPSEISASVTGNLTSVIAGRISYILDLRGPSMVVNTGRSSSLMAVHLACRALRNRECAMAIAGSVRINLLPVEDGYSYQEDADDEEGVTAVLLKPLNMAVKDEDHIYGIIKGSAVNQDGDSQDRFTHSTAAREDVKANAFFDAELDPKSLSYIMTDDSKFNSGKLAFISGITGMIKSVLALKAGQISRYADKCWCNWAAEGVPVRWGISSFQPGGTYCHIVLEEYLGRENIKNGPKDEPENTGKPTEILTLSAKSEQALRRLVERYSSLLEKDKAPVLKDICYTANTGRGQYSHRLAVLAVNCNDLKKKIDIARYSKNLDEIDHDSIYYGEHRIMSESNDGRSENEITESEMKVISRKGNLKIREYKQASGEDGGVLQEICGLYVKGAEIDWEELYRGEKRKKTGIPTYPFEKRRCWVEPDEDARARWLHTSRIMSELQDNMLMKAAFIDNSKAKQNEDIILKGKEDAAYSEIEIKLARIFGDVLGHREINIHDTFYDLGGDSLIGMSIVNRIVKEMGIKIAIADFFTYPTIRKLTEYIDIKYSKDKTNEKAYSVIPKTSERENYPVSSAQKRMFILSQYSGVGLTLNLIRVMEIEGHIDKERLETAFRTVIERHEILRTSFDMAKGEIVQKISKKVEFGIDFMPVDEDADLEERIFERFVRPFDLKKAPLLRVGLAQTAPDKFLLVFDTHHIISDGTSLAVLSNEVIRIYQGEKLPGLKIQYRDYAAWQNEIKKTEYIKAQERYWLNVFSGEIPVLNLPSDYPRPPIKTQEAGLIPFKIEEKVTKALNELAEATGTTLYMVIMTAYYIFLAKLTGQKDIVVGSPIAGRHHADLENLIGIFVNSLALKNHPDGEKTLLQFLLEVKESILKAYENQDYQFEELVEKLGIQNVPGRTPLFDTMLVFQNKEYKVAGLADLKITLSEKFLQKISTMITVYDILLDITEEDDGISCKLAYYKKLFRKESIEGFVDGFTHILDEIAGCEHARQKSNQAGSLKIKDIELIGNNRRREMTPQIENDGSDIDIEFNFQ